MSTAERLAQVRRDAMAEAACRPAKGEMAGGDGRMDMRIPLACLLTAREHEGPEVLTEAADGYWEDMKRLYPECAVKYVPRRLMVGAVRTSGPGMRNRFGRVSWRRSFG